MKIGLVTFHCSYNFGSALQAWALKHKLEEMGHSVDVVDYRGGDFDQYKLIRTDSPKSFVSSLLFYSKNRRRARAFEGFIEANFNCTKRYCVRNECEMGELAASYDAFVCGSDQIWNLDCTQGPVGPFFLSFAGKAKRVAYAPSLSHVSFQGENFDKAAKKKISAWLEQYEAISVREEATAFLFQELTTKRIEACVDPTLLLDASDYEQIVADDDVAPNMLFVYMLEVNQKLVEYATEVAKAFGYHIGYVSKRAVDFGVPATNYYGVGPGEFLGLIGQSSAVLTNSFHATVFSLLYGKPFQTFATEKSGSRMIELLGKLGAADRITKGESVCRPVSAPSGELEQGLKKLRTDSLAFLTRALGE
jgi:hypothetical protein